MLSIIITLHYPYSAGSDNVYYQAWVLIMTRNTIIRLYIIAYTVDLLLVIGIVQTVIGIVQTVFFNNVDRRGEPVRM